MHPILFKLVRFARQRALGDIDFFRSLPCGFPKKDERSDLFVEFLFRLERSLLDTCPFIRSLSARSFRSRHLPLPSDTTTITSSVPDPPKVCKESGNVSQFGLPIYVKHDMRQSLHVSPISQLERKLAHEDELPLCGNRVNACIRPSSGAGLYARVE